MRTDVRERPEAGNILGGGSRCWPVTQSNFNVPAEATTLEKSNILVSKERSVMWGVTAIPSCMRRPVKASPPVASEPQVNWPVVEFQRRVWVSEEQSETGKAEPKKLLAETISVEMEPAISRSPEIYRSSEEFIHSVLREVPMPNLEYDWLE